MRVGVQKIHNLARSSEGSGHSLGSDGGLRAVRTQVNWHSLKSLGWHSVGEQTVDPGMQVCGCSHGSLWSLPLRYSLACPGGPKSPCSDHGVCLDGMSGSGQCKCHSGFAGTACELCAPGTFGPQCQGMSSLSCPIRSRPTSFALCVNLSFSPACHCTPHGRCDEGLGGSGSCFCDEGWTGPRCEVQLGE